MLETKALYCCCHKLFGTIELLGIWWRQEILSQKNAYFDTFTTLFLLERKWLTQVSWNSVWFHIFYIIYHLYLSEYIIVRNHVNCTYTPRVRMDLKFPLSIFPYHSPPSSRIVLIHVYPASPWMTSNKKLIILMQALLSPGQLWF